MARLLAQLRHLHMHDLVVMPRDGNGNKPPRSIGSGASRLLDYLDGSHHDCRTCRLVERRMLTDLDRCRGDLCRHLRRLGYRQAAQDAQVARTANAAAAVFENRCARMPSRRAAIAAAADGRGRHQGLHDRR